MIVHRNLPSWSTFFGCWWLLGYSLCFSFYKFSALLLETFEVAFEPSNFLNLLEPSLLGCLVILRDKNIGHFRRLKLWNHSAVDDLLRNAKFLLILFFQSNQTFFGQLVARVNKTIIFSLPINF